ncbi:MAG: hypothetical protein A2W22_00510 [Candidatus Levybacteria bacterium RBG_16_35_11]|nr:MAG: hypothetical protein A2W22_00510 [Candidatus Levybacteria bacterium RBG_16_35_11]
MVGCGERFFKCEGDYMSPEHFCILWVEYKSVFYKNVFMKWRLFSIFFFSGFLLFGISVTAKAVEFSDNFDSYTLGSNINTQGGWIASGSNVISDTQAVTVPHSVFSPALGQKMEHPATGDYWHISVFATSTQSSFYWRLADVSDNRICDILNLSGAWTLVTGVGSNKVISGTVTAGEWNDFEIYQDSVLKACKARINNGPWTDLTAYSDILTIHGIYIYPAGGDFYDEVSVSDVAYDDMPSLTIEEPVITGPWTDPLHVKGLVYNADRITIYYTADPPVLGFPTQAVMYERSFSAYDLSPFPFDFYFPLVESTGTVTFIVENEFGSKTYERDVVLGEPVWFAPVVSTSTDVSLISFDEMRTFCADTFPEGSWTDDVIRGICELGAWFVVPSGDSIDRVLSSWSYIGSKFPFGYAWQIHDDFNILASSSTSTSATISIPMFDGSGTSSIAVLDSSTFSSFPWIEYMRDWLGFAFYLVFMTWLFYGVTRII